MEKGLPPPGGDQNQAAKMITTYAVLTSLSVAIVAVRFIARAVGSQHYGPLKAAYREQAERMERGGVNTIGKQHFTYLYRPAREKALY